MNGPREPFLSWPEKSHLKFALVVSLIGCLWFTLVYVGCDAIAARRATRFRIHFDWELNLPFVPEMVCVYMSIYLLFIAAPFVLRRRHELLALAITLNVVILVAGISFLLLPASLAFAPASDLGRFPNLFRFADRLNLTYNLVPSLHVALSTVCIAAFASRTDLVRKILLWGWAVAIAGSTLLTHQHHVLDVVAGLLLALLAVKTIFQRITRLETVTFPR